MKISRFITRDSRLALSVANFAIAVGETTFSLSNVVKKKRSPIWRVELVYSRSVIDKHKTYLTPQEVAIFIDTSYELSFVTVIHCF